MCYSPCAQAQSSPSWHSSFVVLPRASAVLALFVIADLARCFSALPLLALSLSQCRPCLLSLSALPLLSLSLSLALDLSQCCPCFPSHGYPCSPSQRCPCSLSFSADLSLLLSLSRSLSRLPLQFVSTLPSLSHCERCTRSARERRRPCCTQVTVCICDCSALESFVACRPLTMSP
jgi:hypothetical protein